MLKMLQEKIPTSQVMKDCFGSDTEEEDNGDPQDISCPVMAQGVVFAEELPQESPVDENQNTVVGDGDKVNTSFNPVVGQQLMTLFSL